MYSSAFFKFTAREKLKNCYFALLVGALIYMIPTYLATLISGMFNYNILEGRLIAQGINLLINLIVGNILFIGFIRLLANVKPEGADIRQKCDYRLMFSGYKQNFKNTLKITLLREAKVFLWGLIAFIPAAAAMAIIITLVAVRDSNTMGLFLMIANFLETQTVESMEMLQSFAHSAFPHLPLYITLFIGTTAVASIPVVYKSYEYMMIPMILADHPDITAKKAFKRSKDIMDGFRMRYFLLQLSFVFYTLLAAVILTSTGFFAVYIAALAAIMPYKHMAYLEFYRQRDAVIEYNIEKYGEQT